MSNITQKIQMLTEDEAKSFALLPRRSFQELTTFIRKHPHNPILWYNRAVAVFAMGHFDQAFWDAKHTCDLIQSWQPLVVNALVSSLPPINFENAVEKLYFEAQYTFARALIASHFRSDYFLMALSTLKAAIVSFPHDADFQTKAKRLEKEAEGEYAKVLQHMKLCQPGLDYDNMLRRIDRRSMRDGRYPWDMANARDRASRTKEGLQELEREYNEVLGKLGASRVEVRFSKRHGISGLRENVQRTPGAATEGLQIGMYAKIPIHKGESVLHERPFASVNRRLDNELLCEHCGVGCYQHPHSHECPRCHIAYCSAQCRKDADAMYHNFLCGRRDRFEWLFELIRKGNKSAGTFPSMVVKWFAMSIQTSTPPLELPCIRHLRPWSPPAQDSTSYVMAPTTNYYYSKILEAFDIGTEHWLDFDYWVYETLCRKRILKLLWHSILLSEEQIRFVLRPVTAVRLCLKRAHGSTTRAFRTASRPTTRHATGFSAGQFGNQVRVQLQVLAVRG
ncbi:hypothetical protein BC938DRAFT_476529 [Jimgerdemannia flammicorona]|uniref:MYND-type domain-containing protein n=1 Tax=Jimgerdemannia flammicorona TaxID=994334 RepID=A0A433PGD7_9FUNG|nr:hypothetical protein BC938DRAFT_476529 [Jimgerdemannia flammicorona]